MPIRASSLGPWIIIGAGLIINLGLWLSVWLFFPNASDTAILHYSLDVGIDFIGAGQQITVLPLAGLILLIGNVILGFAIQRADRRAAWIMWSALPLIQVILSGAFLLIWQANR